MAKKPTIRYVCSNCGQTHGTWSGRCSACGEWNTLQEEVEIATSSGKGGRSLQSSKVSDASYKAQNRISTGLQQVDMVLGGGLVPGSVTLIAGEPGIGKSTLLMQIASSSSGNVIYVSGEESAHQVSARALRLGGADKDVSIASSTDAADIAATISTEKPDLLIVDSIQTVSLSTVGSSPGSVSQITNSTHLLSQAAKLSNTALILVGHVTKEGSIAGPKVLEHLVDTVLQLEGDRYGGLKILRSVKNRFGPTNESGIFEMMEDGLQPVDNPSAALLAERQVTDGSVVTATLEGSRALLVEIQSLVNKTSFGYPKRAASGLELNRLNLLIAMLERRADLDLSDKDVYINVVGGLRITEPATDLAVCLAIASAALGRKIEDNTVIFGEVGLSGEVRHVPFAERRVQEAVKLGFDAVIGPASKKSAGKQLVAVRDVRTTINKLLKK